MNENRAYMIAHIEIAVLAARKAGDQVVEYLLEQALREALGSEHKDTPMAARSNIKQDNEPYS